MPAADASMIGIIPNILESRQRSTPSSPSSPSRSGPINQRSKQLSPQASSSSQQTLNPEKENQPPISLTLDVKWMGSAHQISSEEVQQHLSQEMTFSNSIDISPDATYQEFFRALLKVLASHDTVWKDFKPDYYVEVRAVRAGLWQWGKGVEVDENNWESVLREAREGKVLGLRVVCRIKRLSGTVGVKGSE